MDVFCSSLVSLKQLVHDLAIGTTLHYILTTSIHNLNSVFGAKNNLELLIGLLLPSCIPPIPNDCRK